MKDASCGISSVRSHCVYIVSFGSSKITQALLNSV